MNEGLIKNENIDLIDKVKRRILSLKELHENLRHEEELNRINGGGKVQQNPVFMEIAQVLSTYNQLLDILIRPVSNDQGYNATRVMEDLEKKFHIIIDNQLGGGDKVKE